MSGTQWRMSPTRCWPLISGSSSRPSTRAIRSATSRTVIRRPAVGRAQLPVGAGELLAGAGDLIVGVLRLVAVEALAVDAHARGDEQPADRPLGQRLQQDRGAAAVDVGVLGDLVHALADADP